MRSSPDLRAPAAVLCRTTRAQEDPEAELAHLAVVAAAELHLLDPLAVHVGAVEAAHVTNREPGAVPVELGMPPRDGYIVEEDIALRMAARSSQLAVQEEPAPGVRPAAHDEQRRAGRKRGQGRRIGQRIVAELGIGLVGAGGGNDRCRLGPALCAIAKRSAAMRAETSLCRVRPAAAGAVDARHLLAEPSLRRPPDRSGNHIGLGTASCVLRWRCPSYLCGGAPVQPPRTVPPREAAPGRTPRAGRRGAP